ncbi:unnamed protein product [Polarella glacialis]|uniref:Exostosin GT47 domain-containing protein n=1 Tax=Polarella glacialis TaxID=89957 RepID=A0A813J4R0_POLGL|nr:unnamed protein product [Polarella glacialis]
MGSGSSGRVLLGTAAAYFVCFDAKSLPSTSYPSREKPCPHYSNSTSSVLRCILWKNQTGESAFDEETNAPKEEQDDEVLQYFEELSRSKERLTEFSSFRTNVFSHHFRDQLFSWSRGGMLPRIYMLDEMDKTCAYMEESLGYRYSMEHWFAGMITMNPNVLVDNVEAADYVFLPHCATGVFMHMVVKDLKREEEEEEKRKERKATAGHRPSAGTRKPVPLRRLPPVNASIAVRRRMGDNFLGYEGNLPATPVQSLDRTYLMYKVLSRFIPHPEYQQCLHRSDCKFLIASIYGRHVWREFASHYGDKAVFVTHAGMSPWLLQQPSDMFVKRGQDELRGRSTGGTAHGECRASCELHCVLDPPAVLQQDIVLPWVVAFEWTSRSRQTRDRDILAFYGGTENSCSRRDLREVFQGSLQKELDYLEAPPQAASAARGPHNARKRVLIFPPDFRLLQQDWSELAYRSRLCIVPDGDSPNTGRLIEVIMHGCVPLIISNRLQPPLHEYIDWSLVAFFMREESISDLPRILEERFAGPRGQEEILKKQELLQQVAYTFDYNANGVGTLLTIALRERMRSFRLSE